MAQTRRSKRHRRTMERTFASECSHLFRWRKMRMRSTSARQFDMQSTHWYCPQVCHQMQPSLLRRRTCSWNMPHSIKRMSAAVLRCTKIRSIVSLPRRVTALECPRGGPSLPPALLSTQSASVVDYKRSATIRLWFNQRRGPIKSNYTRSCDAWLAKFTSTKMSTRGRYCALLPPFR